MVPSAAPVAVAVLLVFACAAEASGAAIQSRCRPLDGTQTAELLAAAPPDWVKWHTGLSERSFCGRPGRQHGIVDIQSGSWRKTTVLVSMVWDNNGTAAQPWHFKFQASDLPTIGELLALSLYWLGETGPYEFYYHRGDPAALLRGEEAVHNIAISAVDYQYGNFTDYIAYPHSIRDRELGSFYWDIIQAGYATHRW